jgi:hypothetical protein
LGITPGLSRAIIFLSIATSYIDLVVPGYGFTAVALDFFNALIKLDLPTFGKPTTPTVTLGFSSVLNYLDVFLRIFISSSDKISAGS